MGKNKNKTSKKMKAIKNVVSTVLNMFGEYFTGQRYSWERCTVRIAARGQ